MEFEKRKAAALAALSAQRPDKSPKGTLDAPIIPLIEALNLNPSYFTTSSCSGRISIFSHQLAAAASGTDNKSEGSKKKKKAGGGGWIFVSHDPAEPEAVVDLLFPKDDHAMSGFSGGGTLVFRFEPLIVAVECTDAVSAQLLVSTAISCGFRESGVTSLHKRVMVAIRCSIRLEVPLGEIGQVLVSPEYVQYLVGIANEKMEANRRRTDGFLLALKCKVPQALTMVAANNHQRQESSFVRQRTLDKKDVVTERSILENAGTKPAATYTKDESTKTLSKSSTCILNHSKESGVTSHTQDKTNIEGLSRAPECRLISMTMMIFGEPADKLLLWGQSACTLSNQKQNQIHIFGGFGGLGRHARRNNSLILNPHSGLLKEINAKGPPSPRMGHTSLVLGDCVFVIGGREGPLQILNDVWILDTIENKWMLVECTGSVFQPRHRHAAAVVGSNIYVFGGLNNEAIYHCMHVLDTRTLQWNEVKIQGSWPSARHSLSMVAYGSQIFMFGGYDGERALGDLHIFDIGTFLWKNVKTTGRAPFPRFSHSMFVYENFVGVIGGCPISQHHQEVALLDMPHRVWRHLIVDSVGPDLWVRSSTVVIDNDLVIVGGGVSCYAFGAKFNKVMKINLRTLLSAKNSVSEKEEICITQCNGPLDNHENAFNGFSDAVSVTNEEPACSNHSWCSFDCCKSSNGIHISACGGGHDLDAKHLVLRLEKKYAKLGKDILKAFGWLDLGRKIEPSQDGVHICLPISCAFCLEKICRASETDNNFDSILLSQLVIGKGISVKNLSRSRALSLLLACGCSIGNDDKACSIKVPKSPQKMMKDAVCSLIKDKEMLPQLLEQLPTRWERLGDIVVLPATSFKDPIWNSIGDELWQVVAKVLGANRLGRQGRVLPTGTRDSTLEILLGGNGWVTHHENGINYSFDATKCMFSYGNLSEKLRMAQLDCRDEVVVDLFAGIGYFVLPFLVKAKAKLVYACEWNPHAVEALRCNILANCVADRCIILEGDNRVVAPKGIADRVCLGLLPTSESSWLTAVKALRAEGGTLHVHGNVIDSEERVWSEYVSNSIHNIAESEGYSWDVSVQHLERVKWYGPHIRHLVADIRCKKL